MRMRMRIKSSFIWGVEVREEMDEGCSRIEQKLKQPSALSKLLIYLVT